MGQSLPPNQLELYRRVDEILHYVWDPIGIAGIPEARDEYHGYLPTVYSYLNQENPEQSIRTYLNGVSKERMCLDINEESERRVDRTLEFLLRWKQIILEREKK